MTKSNHQVKVIRVGELAIHPNADTLGIVNVGGYQCVVKKDKYKAGDLAVYVQPDSVVPQSEAFSFLWADKEFPDGAVPPRYRRITVRKFRKEWSEGLLLPICDFLDAYNPKVNPLDWREGDDVAELLGITHYEPEEQVTRGANERGPQVKGWPRSLRGWFYWFMQKIGFDLNGTVGGNNDRGPKVPPPVYDVEAMKNFCGALIPGEDVRVTEKIHGSNARFLFDGKHFFVGSRKLWKSDRSSCIWRKVAKGLPWIEEWCRSFPGFTLYGEVVPTQSGFHYGTNGDVKFFAFDIFTPDGRWLSPHGDGLIKSKVPILYEGPFGQAKVKVLTDGKSTVEGATHIREGVVVEPKEERHYHGLGRLKLKVVSNQFLEQDSK